MCRLTSAKKAGAQRLYFGQPCGARHNSPKGLRCSRREGLEKNRENHNTPPTPGPELEKRKSRRSERKNTETTTTEVETPVKQVGGTRSKRCRPTTAASTDTEEKDTQEIDKMFQILLGQIQNLAEDQRKSRAADKAELQADIKNLAKKVVAPVISDEEDAQSSDNSVLVQKRKTSKEGITDPVYRLR